MNRQQRAVILVGILVVIATGVYAPWLYVVHVPGVGRLTQFAGFGWLFQRPVATNLTGGYWSNHDLVDVELDWDILKAEWAVILLTTLGMLGFLHGSRGGRLTSATVRPFLSAALEKLRRWFRRPRGKVIQPSDLRPKPAPHWALDILAQPNGDLDWAMERAEKGVANPAHFPVGPWQVLFDFNFNEPDIPTWFPREHDGQVLSRQERLIWFDQALEQAGDFPQEWPRYAHTVVRQLFVVDALIGAYEACAEGNLPEPDFTQNLWKTGPPRESRR